MVVLDYEYVICSEKSNRMVEFLRGRLVSTFPCVVYNLPLILQIE